MRKHLLVEKNISRLKKQRLDDEACWKCQINYKQGIFSLRPFPFPSPNSFCSTNFCSSYCDLWGQILNRLIPDLTNETCTNMH